MSLSPRLRLGFLVSLRERIRLLMIFNWFSDSIFFLVAFIFSGVNHGVNHAIHQDNQDRLPVNNLLHYHQYNLLDQFFLDESIQLTQLEKITS